jgi:hypothetical protein
MTDPSTNIPTTGATDATGSNPYAHNSPLADKKNALLRTMPGVVPAQAQTDSATPAQPQSTRTPAVEAPPAHTRPEGLLHTFKDDVQDLVKDQKLSMTKIRAIESDHGREAPLIERSESGRYGALIMFASVIALALVALVGGYYYSTTLQTGKATQSTLAYGMFFTEGYEPVDITNKVSRAVREAFAVVRKRGAFSLGSMIELVPTARVRDAATGELVPQRVGAKDVAHALGIQAPTLFVETLGPLYMVGIHVGDENIPYLVLSTTAYDYAFSGMLAWESTMEEDLAPFMSPNATYTAPANAQSGNLFVDTVVRNHDIRVLRDDSGTIRLLYGIIDRKTIIITTRVETFLAIAERLQVEKQ